MNTEFPTYFSSKHALSMELRDYFAAKVMQSLLISYKGRLNMDDITRCFRIADAMLEVRKENK